MTTNQKIITRPSNDRFSKNNTIFANFLREPTENGPKYPFLIEHRVLGEKQLN